jgi:hypothetical protein
MLDVVDKIRIRDECAQLFEATNDLGEDYLQKIDEHPRVVT